MIALAVIAAIGLSAGLFGWVLAASAKDGDEVMEEVFNNNTTKS
jgi:hypothetical protein